MKLSEFKSSEYDPVIGTTMILHKPRTKLGLTLGEYTVAKLIEYCETNNKELTGERAFLHIGIETEDLVEYIDSLINQGIARWNEGDLHPILLLKWHKIHSEAISEQFDRFWEKEYGIRWGGSKAQARQKFDILMKEIDFAYIMAQKRAYFMFLCLPENDWRHVMGGAVFLGKTDKRYSENWAVQLKEAGAKRKPIDTLGSDKRPKITKQKKKDLFS